MDVALYGAEYPADLYIKNNLKLNYLRNRISHFSSYQFKMQIKKILCDFIISSLDIFIFRNVHYAGVDQRAPHEPGAAAAQPAGGWLRGWVVFGGEEGGASAASRGWKQQKAGAPAAQGLGHQERGNPGMQIRYTFIQLFMLANVTKTGVWYFFILFSLVYFKLGKNETFLLSPTVDWFYVRKYENLSNWTINFVQELYL